MINGDDYQQQLGRVLHLSELLEYSLSVLSTDEDAQRKYARSQLQKFQDVLEQASRLFGKNTKSSWVYHPESQSEFLTAIKDKHLPNDVEHVQNRLRQHQLLLFLAYFESFLKDIHRELLLADKELFARCHSAQMPKRKIEVGRLIAKGEAVLVEEERETLISTIWTKNPKEQVKYFAGILQLPWLEAAAHDLSAVKDQRNRILHSEPDSVVSEAELDRAFTVCFQIPATLVVKGSVLYPERFTWPGVDCEKTVGQWDELERTRKGA